MSIKSEHTRGASKFSESQIARGAWLLFNKANPELPDAPRGIDREQWFELTRDYWMRAARELAAAWWPPMEVCCPCGWSASGPAGEVSWANTTHKCEKTDPWWNERRSHRDYY